MNILLKKCKGIAVSFILLVVIISLFVLPTMAIEDPYAFVKDLVNMEGDCNVAVAGKGVTADGSIIFMKSEDAGIAQTDFAWQIPRKQYPEGAVVKLFYGGTIPQVRETYAYKYFECPTTPYSSAVWNEWGLMIGSNGCTGREYSGNYRTPEEIKELEAAGQLKNGGIGTLFRFILMERCKTAREAVELGVKLIDEYGYNASGRNYNIVDTNEAWNLQVATGKHYVARKLQDNEVFIIANTFNIHEVDMNDKENWICAPDLIDYAVKKGWYDPASGKPFDWAMTYAPENAITSASNTVRHWNLGRQLSSTFMSWEEAKKGWIPTTVIPDNKKLTPKDFMDIERNHLAGTELDLSTAPVPGDMVGYWADPHTMTNRTNCNASTIRLTIYQSRSWLPPELQVAWNAAVRPCTSLFIPWYCGMTNTPPAWRMAPEGLDSTQREFLDYHFNPAPTTWEFNYDSACNIFGMLAYLVDNKYDLAIGKVKEAQAKFEQTEFALQADVEAAALSLYKKDPELAKEYLTLYTFAQAEKAIKIAKELINDFRYNFWGKNK